jgi:GMP synthase-like glutamine amidotransferase
VLVVMGGPMGVADLGDPAYPFLDAEVELLRRRIAADAPVLGVCLGAQLLAHAAGARVYPNTRPSARPGGAPLRVYEVGWAPVDFLAAGEPALAGLGAHEVMLHWHGDTFELPAGATLLASTPQCRNQAFRLGRRIYGVQFHCEVDRPLVEAFTREDAAYIAQANGPEGQARIAADTDRLFARFREVSGRLIANLVDQLT